MNVLEQILKHKIVAIMRGVNPTDVVKIATALHAGGIRILEITMNSAEPFMAIKEVIDKLGDKMIVGAGTVINVDDARAAVNAGAKFVLSPTVDADIIKATKQLGVLSIPGAFTATEILAAYKLGGDIIKVFPANSPAYIKDIGGPLSHIPLLPTGGITPENIADFKNAGAVGFGIGSALINTKQPVTDEALAQITSRARQFVAALND